MSFSIEDKVAWHEPLTQEDIDEILVECYKSTKLFAKLFFKDHVYAGFSEEHDRLFDVLDGTDRRVVIIAPRGIGKTTLVNTIYCAKRIVYRDCNFLSVIENTETQALMDTELLKNELLSNEYLIEVFGSIKPQNRETSFSKKGWQSCELKGAGSAHNGTFILPRGNGQQVRGIKHGRFRYDLILCDDLEKFDPGVVVTPEMTEQLKRWFKADVEPSVSQVETMLGPGEFPWRMIVVGSLLGENSLLAELRDSADWKSVVLEYCDDNLKSKFPTFKTDEQIQDRYRYYEEAGQLDVFMREFRSVPVSVKTADFQASFFKYFNEGDLAGVKGLESIVIADPARKTEEQHADTAIIGWTLDSLSGKLYVRDLIVGKLKPDDIYKQAAEMGVRIGALTIGIEETGLGEFLTQPFENFLRSWGYNFNFVALKSRGAKNEKANRVQGLLPYYRQGRIWHNKACCTILEQQLLTFPFSRRWDAMDCAAYVVEMLHLGERFFTPASYAEGKSFEDAFKEIKKTWAPPLKHRDELPTPASLDGAGAKKIRAPQDFGRAKPSWYDDWAKQQRGVT